MLERFPPPDTAGHLATHAEATLRCAPSREVRKPGIGTASQPDWLLWQLADSAFPTGGFAHSSGIEAAWHHGELRTSAELASFVDASLRQFGRNALPFTLAAYAEPGRLIELDQLCDSFTLNHVANRASRSQGRALLASAERIFALPELQALRPGQPRQPPCCHLAPMFGVVARSLDLGCLTTCRLFLFLHLRGLIASAVRLGVIGPLAAQTIQHSLGGRAEEIVEMCQSLTIDDIAQTSPLLELWQGTQDRLYSRLFQS